MSFLGAAGGHFWTVWPVVRHAVRPPRMPSPEVATALVDDPRLGLLKLRAVIDRATHSPTRRAIVAVHGLGGETESPYVVNLARAALDAEIDCVRVGLRGSDLTGEDVYHAGIVEDLRAVIALPELDRYEELVVVGYSMGGHLALRYAALSPDPRVKAVVAIGSPLDLSSSVDALDEPLRAPYRSHVMRYLVKLLAAATKRGRSPIPLAEGRTIRSLRVWDERVVAPRFGFTGAADYYAKMSVAPLLSSIAIPAHYLGASFDPMVPRHVVAPWLTPNLLTRWIDDAGHVGFPGDLDLGFGPRLGLAGQLVGLAKRV